MVAAERAIRNARGIERTKRQASGAASIRGRAVSASYDRVS
jgi:hypothetical protein